MDDGGFSYVDPDNPSEEITFDAYKNILELAREFEIRIPICFTMRYLDINNVSGCGQPVSYAMELIDLLGKNREYIEIGYHGLIHDNENHVGEFYLLDVHTPVSEEIQRDHVYKSSLIFKDLGWPFPKLFVPPTHAWELGTTDKILAEYGVRYLVSHPRLKYRNHTYKWYNSQYLTFLPREDMGIWSYDTLLQRHELEDVKKWILPRNMINNVLLFRRLSNKRVHSYMTHIANFKGRSYEFWKAFFQYIKQNPQYDLVKSNEDVISRYFVKH